MVQTVQFLLIFQTSFDTFPLSLAALLLSLPAIHLGSLGCSLFALLSFLSLSILTLLSLRVYLFIFLSRNNIRQFVFSSVSARPSSQLFLYSGSVYSPFSNSSFLSLYISPSMFQSVCLLVCVVSLIYTFFSFRSSLSSIYVSFYSLISASLSICLSISIYQAFCVYLSPLISSLLYSLFHVLPVFNLSLFTTSYLISTCLSIYISLLIYQRVYIFISLLSYLFYTIFSIG